MEMSIRHDKCFYNRPATYVFSISVFFLLQKLKKSYGLYSPKVCYSDIVLYCDENFLKSK